MRYCDLQTHRWHPWLFWDTQSLWAKVDTPGDSKVSQCVCFSLILTLPVIKGVQRRCLIVHSHGPGWPEMHCPPASASRLARFRTTLTKLPWKQFEFSCLYTVCPLEDAWWPCLDLAYWCFCLPSLQEGPILLNDTPGTEALCWLCGASQQPYMTHAKSSLALKVSEDLHFF